MTKATRIAFADTKHLGRARWSELAVYHLKDSDKPWLAVSTGMSSRDGEVPIVDRQNTFGLERALDLFDDSAIGRSVKSQALDWAEHHQAAQGIASDGNVVVSGTLTPTARFTGTTDQEALDWLFGKDAGLRPAARAFDMGESTLRMALKNQTAVRVPLAAIARYVDRERFQADQVAASSDA